jgi:hypothetical protein
LKPFNAAAADLFAARPGLRSFSWVDPGSPDVDPPEETKSVLSLLANSTFVDKPNRAVRIIVGRPGPSGPCPVSTRILL